MAVFLRKYNTLTVTGTTAIRIPMVKRGVVDFAVGADWTPASGDVKIAIDGASPANVTNLPAAVASGNTAYWEFILTAAESSCKSAVVTVADSATKAVEDQFFVVETFGNASAMYQADLSAANLPANVTQLLGTAWLTPGTAGTPDVNVKLWNALATVALPLIPTVAGRTLDVSTGGEAGVDWANVGSPTTSIALTGTTIAVTQKVDVDTIKTNPVANGGTVTFPTNATLASTTNITAGTIATVTTLTNLPAITANWLTATGIAADAITAAKIADSAIDAATFAAGAINAAAIADGAIDAATFAAGAIDAAAIATDAIGANEMSAAASAKIAAAVWDLATSGHTTSGTFGDAMSAAGASGDPWTTSLPGSYSAGQAGYIVGTNLNALITSRMATYSQPTGFLAAAFPGTVASTTNITAGTITTVTTVTNQLTAAAIATGVWQDTTAGDFTVSGSIGRSLFTSGVVPGAAGGLFIAGTNAATVVTTSFTTTFTGNLTGNVGGSVGSVTAAVTLPTIPANWITAAGLATDAGTEIASAVLKLDVDTVEATAAADSLAGLILTAYYSSTATGDLVTTRTDGTTGFSTKTLTTDPAAEPITGVG